MAGFGRGLVAGLAVGAAGLVLLAGLTAPEGAMPEAPASVDEGADNLTDGSRMQESVTENGADAQRQEIDANGGAESSFVPIPDTGPPLTHAEPEGDEPDDSAAMAEPTEAVQDGSPAERTADDREQQADAEPAWPLPILPVSGPPLPLAQSGQLDDGTPNLPRGFSGDEGDFDNTDASLVQLPPKPPEGPPKSSAPEILKESDGPKDMRSAFDLAEDQETDALTISERVGQGAARQDGIADEMAGNAAADPGRIVDRAIDDGKTFSAGDTMRTGDGAAVSAPDETRDAMASGPDPFAAAVPIDGRDGLAGDESGAADHPARNGESPNMAIIASDPLPRIDHISDPAPSDIAESQGPDDEGGPTDPGAPAILSGLSGSDEGLPASLLPPSASTSGVDLDKRPGHGFSPPDLSIPPAFADLFQTRPPSQSEGSR